MKMKLYGDDSNSGVMQCGRHAMIFRSKNSGSNLYRRELCPGSAAAEDGLPEFEVDNFFAKKGTRLHEIEAEGELDDSGLKLLEKRAIMKNERLSNEFVAGIFRHLQLGDPGTPVIYRERELFFYDHRLEPVAPLMAGHADEIRHYPKHNIAFVFDSKFGLHPVTQADSNLQLGFYTVAAADDIGGEKFYAAIRQPFLKAPQDFHHVQYLPGDVDDMRDKILAIVAATEAEDAPRRPSVDACWFCRAKGTAKCPESLAFLEDVQRAQIKTMRPDHLESIADSIRMTAEIIESWKAQMRFILKNYPHLIKTYELGVETKTHAIKNAVAARNAVARSEMLGNPGQDLSAMDAEFLGACKVSIPDLARAVGKYNALTEKDALATVMGLGDEIIESKPKERALKRKRGLE